MDSRDHRLCGRAGPGVDPVSLLGDLVPKMMPAEAQEAINAFEDKLDRIIELLERLEKIEMIRFKHDFFDAEELLQ